MLIFAKHLKLSINVISECMELERENWKSLKWSSCVIVIFGVIFNRKGEAVNLDIYYRSIVFNLKF